MAGVDRLSIGGVDVTGAFDEATKRSKITKIVNGLLNGQPNVQIIGDPAYIFSVHTYADLAGHDVLDTTCLEGTEITLHYHGEEYVGIMEEAELEWEVVIPDLGNEWFGVTFNLLVLEQL